MKKMIHFLSVLLMLSSTACIDDDIGPRGPVGAPGPAGPAGENGSQIVFGTGQPQQNLGENGWTYIQTDSPNLNLFHKESGLWILKGTLKGTPGEQGLPGTNANVWIHGIGIPHPNVGNENDYYLDIVTYDVYKKTANGWEFPPLFNMRPTGSLIIIDNGIPSDSIGKNLDVYINIQSGDVYSKNGSTWDYKGTIRGNDGTNGVNGIDGVDGATWLSGNGDPATTLGKEGDFYLDLTKRRVHKKVSNTLWVEIANFAIVPQYEYYFQNGYTNYQTPEGVYSGEKDTFVRGWSNGGVASSNFFGSSNLLVQFDIGNVFHSNSLIKFDVSAVRNHFGIRDQCIDEIDIDAAFMNFNVSAIGFDNASAGFFQYLEMIFIRPSDPQFVPEQASWNRMASGVPWRGLTGNPLPDSSPSGGGTMMPGPRSLNRFYFSDLRATQWISFHVPKDVIKNWICDDQSNKGAIVLTPHSITGIVTSQVSATLRGGINPTELSHMLYFSVRRKNSTAGGRQRAPSADEVLQEFMTIRSAK